MFNCLVVNIIVIVVLHKILIGAFRNREASLHHVLKPFLDAIEGTHYTA